MLSDPYVGCIIYDVSIKYFEFYIINTMFLIKCCGYQITIIHDHTIKTITRVTLCTPGSTLNVEVFTRCRTRVTIWENRFTLNVTSRFEPSVFTAFATNTCLEYQLLLKFTAVNTFISISTDHPVGNLL